MRFNLDIDANRYFIKGYGSGWINVNEREIRRSVIVTPDQLVTDWSPQTFADLEAAHFEAIAQLEPEIVLLGTGDRQPHRQARASQAGRQRQRRRQELVSN